jgi:hypothetical protein
MFLENKYTKWYLNIIEKANKECRKRSKLVYYEKHHIIPQSMGGIETVLLTAKEHFICHLLLCKMLKGQEKYKMINALIRMAFSKSRGQKRYTSKSYSLIRSFIASKNSEMFKGKPKSDKARKNMKGNSGTWIRLEKHKERMKGKNNPMYGKTGDNNPVRRPEVREKLRQLAILQWKVKKEKINALGEKK